MTKKTKNNLVIFEEHSVRREWDGKKEKWYFSVIDIISVLVEQPDFRKAKSYWTTLKGRLKKEGSELVTKCDQLKMQSADGKFYKTDVASIETILRLIQSIPSKKAEPFKLWLAKVGKERIDEIADPELAVSRAKGIYEKKGYPKDWVDKRMRGIAVRNTLTDEWSERDIKKGNEFGILTNEIYKNTFDEDYKSLMKIKNLDKKNKDNLRDHMGDIELILTMLAEATSTDISRSKNSKGLEEIRIDVKKGGKIAGEAREKIEKETNRKVVMRGNFKEAGGQKKLK
ncbi:MAG: BRO family protein [Candidatus Moraniibacteriota bacterium]